MNTATSPQRLASLSTEAVDILYRLGVQDRLVGISGFTVYPQAGVDYRSKSYVDYYYGVSAGEAAATVPSAARLASSAGMNSLIATRRFSSWSCAS